MKDTDCEEIYQRFADFLNQAGLQWMVAQVTEQIRLGKTIEREVETFREGDKTATPNMFSSDMYAGSLKKGPKVKFPVTVAYEPSERLLLLVDAVEHVLVDTAEMQQQVASTFTAEIKDWGGIRFYADESSERYTLVGDSSASNVLNDRQRLKHLLDDLRKEVQS
jgi:hypothetical protein